MMHRPPRLFHRFFRWFCHPDLLPSIEGDLLELYDKRVRQTGKGRADRLFAWDVLLLLRPGIIRPPRIHRHANSFAMWKNYLTISWRNIARNRGYSLINIGGLTVGMAVAIFLGLWVYDELSFDRYHPYYDRTARIYQHVHNNGNLETWRNIPYPLADELRQHYADDFELIVLSSGFGQSMINVDGKNFEPNGAFFEPGGPEVLGLSMVRGTSDVLADPSKILLSETAAQAYFGQEDPLGKALKLDGMDVTVAGIFADLPPNSTFAALQFIAPWKLYYDSNELGQMSDPWRPNGFRLHVRMKPGADPVKVSDRIKDALLKNLSEQLAVKKPALFIFPMSDWHLRSEFRNGQNVGGAIQYVWLFGLTGVFVLILACINFMNLSTAQAERRSREVGIRKSMGSLRGQLVSQFFTESVLVAIVALAMALILVQLLLPSFNLLVGKQIVMPWLDVRFLCMAMGFAVFTGVLAGSYPAVFLSSFQPVTVLKGMYKPGRRGGLPRQVLVVLQFSVSVTLIIGTWVVAQQIQFGKDRSVGYTREGLVTVPMVTPALRQHFEAFREEVLGTGQFSLVARSTNPTTYTGNSSSMFNWQGKDPGLSVDFPYVYVSPEFGDAVGWDFLSGRDFSRAVPSDTAALVINEAAAKYLGFNETVGETIRWRDEPYTIIGVVRDMVMDSPFEPVRPTVFGMTSSGGYLIVLRMAPNVVPAEAVAALEKIYQKYAPGDPFSYSFVDQEYATKFGDQEQTMRLAGILAALAIFISCLGIFGLASYVAERRTKEVGIRKVMGASLANLWQLLSRDFVFLVLISFALAFPAAAYFSSDWLARFTYRITVDWWVYLASGGIAMVITLATVSYHTLKVAGSNPVKSLRVE